MNLKIILTTLFTATNMLLSGASSDLQAQKTVEPKAVETVEASTIEEVNEMQEEPEEENLEEMQDSEDEDMEEIHEEEVTETSNPYIIDLDFCTDVDDACAVRMATSLDKLGVIDLKAMMLSTTGENNITALHGILTYDGYENIPIGSSALTIPDTSPYWSDLSAYSSANMTVENAVTLYREVLATSTDKVTIVTTGYVTNVSELLNSQPDGISDLTGAELVKEKVKAIYIVGGAYPDGFDNNFFAAPEAIPAIKNVVNTCEAPIYFITSNVGGPVKCGAILQQEACSGDPVSVALYDFGTTDGRAAWDPFGVWVSAFSNEETNTYIQKTDIVINDDGSNYFVDSEDGKFYRIGRTSEDLNWYKDQLDSYMVK
jgi:hypothetical protein